MKSGEIVSELWKSDTCGKFGHRALFSEYFLDTKFVDNNFRTEKQVKYFFGTPDAIMYDKELKGIFIYEYVIMGTNNCLNADEKNGVHSSMEIYFNQKSKKIKGVTFATFD